METNELKEFQYKLYQLPVKEDTCFASLDTLARLGKNVSAEKYKLKYEGIQSAVDVSYAVEDLYMKLNIDHPKDYHTRSMSVSDVIVITLDGLSEAYFCDNIGFKPVPEFLKGGECNG